MTAAMSTYLDETIGPKCGSDRELGWERIGKVPEEYGEVVEAWLGSSGTNPRKGRTHTVADVKTELLDVALCALGAWEHLDGNFGRSEAALFDHAAARCERMFGSSGDARAAVIEHPGRDAGQMTVRALLGCCAAGAVVWVGFIAAVWTVAGWVTG
jgi:NTP pyrophosphatase (non-canonical NTP hydrolase)